MFVLWNFSLNGLRLEVNEQEAKDRMPHISISAWPYEADFDQITNWASRRLEDFEKLAILGEGNAG